MVVDHKNQYYKQSGDFGKEKHIILTGHLDGKVLVWKLFQYVGLLESYKGDSVLCITKCFDGVAIGTSKGLIYIWDTFLLKC